MPGGGGRRESFDIMQHDKITPRGVIHFTKREVYLSCGCFMGPGWSWDVGTRQRNTKEGASGPRLGKLYTKAEESVLFVLWSLEEFVIGYKKDLGEEVVKKDVTTQYLKQAEFIACLHRESCTCKAPSRSKAQRPHTGFGEAWRSGMGQLSEYLGAG